MTAPTKFFVVIPRDICDLLLPEERAAFGLYAQLSDAVTCGVPHEDKTMGLVLGGSAMNYIEWAKRFRMSQRSFERAIAVLKKLKLIILDRGQRDTKIAVTDSVKRTKRHGKIDHFPWLLGLPEPPNMAGQDDSRTAKNGGTEYKFGGTEYKFGGTGLTENPASQDDSTSYREEDVREERVEEKVEESTAERNQTGAQNSISSLPSSKGKSTSKPEIDRLCAKLYDIGRAVSKYQPTFTAKQRISVGELLASYSSDELCRAYQQHVENRDEFEMRQAPKHFVEGGAIDIVTSGRAPKQIAKFTFLPDDFQPNDEDRDIAKKLRLDLAEALAAFQQKNGNEKTMSDDWHRDLRSSMSKRAQTTNMLPLAAQPVGAMQACA